MSQDVIGTAIQKITEWYAEISEELVRVREERDRLREERDQAVEHAARLHAELYATRKQLQDVCSAKPAGQSDLVRDVSHYIEAAEVDRPTEVEAESQSQIEQYRVLVQEGWWQQADGNRVYVRPTNPSPGNIWKINNGFKWSDGARLYMDDGMHNRNQTTPHDLVKFLGKHVKTQPAEPQQSQPEPQFKPYTFAAYVIGDKSQPDALRIVWATEEWIQHSQFGIVHRMRDMQFFGNDGGCNITEYHETLTLNLEVQ